MGTNSAPVPRDLCGPPGNLDGGPSPLPAGSLNGAIALVSRGNCTFALKAARVRAAGAIGIVLVDNRPGEANGVPIQLVVPGGMISDFDGSALRSYLASRGGRTGIRISRDPQELNTSRSGIVTSFSSGGLTAFGHQLKPDVGAPGAQILSATLKTSVAPSPSSTGRAWLRRTSPELPPCCSSGIQAGPRSGQVGTRVHRCDRLGGYRAAVEAPVLTAGSGLINVITANDPKLFTDPVSLSYSDLNVTRGLCPRSRSCSRLRTQATGPARGRSR